MRSMLVTVGAQFPDCPEGRMWAAVFLQAVADATAYRHGTLNPFHVAEARHYLSAETIYACMIAGVDTEYAHRELARIGLLR